MASVSHYVYRMYDASDSLLYIGCTGNPQRRMRSHRYSTPWFGEVVKTTYEPVRGMVHGFEREMVAIWEEIPRYNKQRLRPKGPFIRSLSDYACTLLTPEWKLRRLIYRGKLRGTRVGMRWFLHLDDQRDYHDGRGKRFRNAIWERDDVTFVSSDSIFKFGMFAGTIESAIIAGEMPARRLNGRYLVRYQDVIDWEERRKEAREKAWKAEERKNRLPAKRPERVPEREWEIMVMYRREKMKLQQVADAKGISRERVRQLDARGMQYLRRERKPRKPATPTPPPPHAPEETP